jgi:lysophospholipase L1-like esterase
MAGGRRCGELKEIPITDELFRGAVSLERTWNGIKPWRIPYQDYDLYPPNGIDTKAEICAGVRLCFHTDSTVIVLKFSPIKGEARLDCMVDGKLFASTALNESDREVTYSSLYHGRKEIIIYLPQNIGMTVSSLWIEQHTEITIIPDTQPKWVTYGSSITQCVGAHSPSRTWPAIAARESGLNLTCLGFSGNCHLEPMVGKLIRDLPADFISLCVGINVYGAASLSPRTFKPALIGMLETIRDKHKQTPLLVISPLYSAHRETIDNVLGFTLPEMREDVRQTVEMIRARGDHHIYYMDGLELFGSDDASYLPDHLHPDGDGYEIIGSRFMEKIIIPFRKKDII